MMTATATAPDYAGEIGKYSTRAIDSAAVAGIVVFACKFLAKRYTAQLGPEDRYKLREVRENFLRRKLRLVFSDAVLDAAIFEVLAKVKEGGQIHRVTLYYLLAARFGKLSEFHARKY